MTSSNRHTVLLTGFEPFGGETENPSAKVAFALHGQQLGGGSVESIILPVAFATALPTLLEAMDEFQPRLVLCLGQAGGEDAICVERVALNLADARIADNDEAQPHDEPIVDDGPVAYWASLPVAQIVSAIESLGIPARISNSAGTFVCNHVFYGLMHALAMQPRAIGGFVHVPFLPGQAARAGVGASMSLEKMIVAIRAAIGAAL